MPLSIFSRRRNARASRAVGIAQVERVLGEHFERAGGRAPRAPLSEPGSTPPARTRIGTGCALMICSIAVPPEIPGSSRSIVTRCGLSSSCESRAIASSALEQTPTTSISGSRASSRESPAA